MRRAMQRPGGHGLVAAVVGVLAVLLGAIVLPALADAESGAPIVITRGGVYSGHFASSDSRTPAVRIATAEPVVIDGATVEGPGTLIRIDVGLAADVTVRNTIGTGTSGADGHARFLVADSGWRSLVVEHNELVSTAGIWAHAARPTTARITHNRVRDVVGTGMVQFVQFDKVIGPVEVAWNEIVNRPGHSSVEDVISVYQSGGSAEAPFRIHDNFIWGAFPDPIDSAYSGGGILVGDQGSDVGHVEVARNQVVGTTNYGISVVCGSNSWVVDNTVVSSGRTASGQWLPATNVGLSMGSEARWGSGCRTYEGNVATGNDLGWQRESGRNDQWVPDCAVCTGNTRRTGPVEYADERAEYHRWAARTASLAIGPLPGPAPGPTTTTASPPPTTAPTTTSTTAAPSTTSTTAPTGADDEVAVLRREIDELRARLGELDGRLAALENGGR